mgnify:CR=1 FL=1
MHALSGRHMDDMPTHTCVTSLLRDEQGGGQGTGCYHLERVDRRLLEDGYLSAGGSSAGAGSSGDSGSGSAHSDRGLAEIKLSQHHLPPVRSKARKLPGQGY